MDFKKHKNAESKYLFEGRNRLLDNLRNMIIPGYVLIKNYPKVFNGS